MMSEKVLVTGGFGLVGSATVRRLAAEGRPVVATDLGTPANRNTPGRYADPWGAIRAKLGEPGLDAD